MFWCESCSYTSKRKFNLQIHIKNKHNRHATDNELTAKSENIEMSTQNIEMSTESIEMSSKMEQMSTQNIEMSTQNCEKNLFCQSCKKTFKSLQWLKKHENTCKGVDNVLQCHHCNQSFASRQSKCKHIKICKIKAAKEQVQQILQAQQQSPVSTTQHNTNNNINNTNNTNNTNNNQIIYQINNYRISNDHYKNKFNPEFDNESIEHINDFGQEDISYISDDQIRQFALNHSLNNFIIEKHFNQEHPENHNIRNNCNKSFKVLRNKRWLPEPKDVVFSVIYNNTRSQMFDFAYKYIFPHLDDEKKEQYMSIVHQYDKYFKRNAYKTIDLQVQELMKEKKLQLLANQNANIAGALC
jgi:hypothetical protein